ncbi:hypothetical protein [Rhizobium phaseoli]|uniref:hypothetical protein n=1 Tax=Rhizobium phaseoli TaxID=396 RepID=UPI000F899CBE|nr:hypothetical protein [Rhizobium phaseoli]
MAVAAKKKLVLPHCRFCGREWLPAEHVSASLAYCDECREERLAFTRARVTGIEIVRGRNGEQVMVPVKRGAAT